MNRTYIFFILALLVSIVDSLKKQSLRRHSKHSGPYITHRPESRSSDSSYSSNEKNNNHKHKNNNKNHYLKPGRIIKHMDLNGDVREKFAYQAMSVNPKVSVICSPLSAMMPLGILIFGAGNSKTEKELFHATGVSSKRDAHSYFRNLIDKVKGLSGITTHLANRIYLSKRFILKSNFKEEAERTFGSCTETVDMSNEAETANKVNNWVKSHTNNEIPEIIRPSDISPKAVVMVVNALYFEAKWEHIFTNTYDEPFYGVNGQRTMRLMHNRNVYLYGSTSGLGAQLIVLPYKGGQASMLIVLPHHRNGLDLLLKQLKLAPGLINKIEMAEYNVELTLPKFKIETTLDLAVLYQKVGLQQIFLEGAGLQQMLRNQTVKIDKAIHKAVISVNELGTKAAAASIMQGVGAAMPPPDLKVFRADHPFLFFIMSNKQQLFAGTFVG